MAAAVPRKVIVAFAAVARGEAQTRRTGQCQAAIGDTERDLVVRTRGVEVGDRDLVAVG